MENYEAWAINSWDYPGSASLEEKIKYFSRYGLLAANIHNTQPWKLKITTNSLVITPDWARKLPELDPTGKNLYISLGCFVKNIEVAAAYHNYKVTISLPKSSEDIILAFKNGKNTELSKLAPFITKRYSNRLPYSGEPISSAVMQKLQLLDTETKVYFSSNKRDIKNSSRLYIESVNALAAKAEITKEIAKWIKPNHTTDGDGMPGFVQGFAPSQTKIGKFIMSILPSRIGAKIITSADDKKMQSSPLISILVNGNKGKTDWLNTGRAFQELALRCFAHDVHITPMHSVVEVKETSLGIAKIFGLGKNLSPQMFFRMGYASNRAYHTPRRNIREVIDTESDLINTIDSPIEKRGVKIGKYNINYIKTGSGHPLVMVHGGNIGWGQFYPNLKEFAKRFTVYALDMPGAGRSTKVDFKKMDFTKDQLLILEGFIKQLKLRKPHLMGTSIGGWLVLKLAAKNYDSFGKLVVADPVGFSDYQTTQSKIMGIYPLTQLLTKTLFKPSWQNDNLEMLIRSTFYNQSLNLSREFINYFYETTFTSHNALYISKMIGSTKDLLLVEDLPKIKNATLVIWGEKDSLLSFEKNKQSIKFLPNAQTKLIKDGGHIISIEKAREFNSIVLDFLL